MFLLLLECEECCPLAPSQSGQEHERARHVVASVRSSPGAVVEYVPEGFPSVSMLARAQLFKGIYAKGGSFEKRLFGETLLELLIHQ